MRNSGNQCMNVTLPLVGEQQMAKRSQPVQRDLPRPADMNSNIMRRVSPNDPPLNDLQKVTFRVKHCHWGSLMHQSELDRVVV